jgi:hypothetical protein
MAPTRRFAKSVSRHLDFDLNFFEAGLLNW